MDKAADFQWMLANLATKSDIANTNADIAELKGLMDKQREATHKLSNSINVDLALWRQTTDARIEQLEQDWKAELDNRRERVRRVSDRNRQRVTWALMCITPIIVLLGWVSGFVHWLANLFNSHPPVKVFATLIMIGVTLSAAESIRPDASLTPGDLLTPAPTLKQLCTPGYASGQRNVTGSLAAKVYAEYGIKHVAGAHEVDHLISLELGGSNDIKNLWPQSYTGDWNAHQKDKLENKLHWLVCHGQMALGDAQQAIRTDWVAEFQRLGLK